MTTLNLIKTQSPKAQNAALMALTCLAILLSIALPYLLSNHTFMGFVDAGIWQLLLIAFLAWIISLWLSIQTFNWLLERLRLPSILIIVQQFNKLTSWQKLQSYFLLFACLLGSLGLTIAAVI